MTERTREIVANVALVIIIVLAVGSLWVFTSECIIVPCLEAQAVAVREDISFLEERQIAGDSTVADEILSNYQRLDEIEVLKDTYGIPLSIFCKWLVFLAPVIFAFGVRMCIICIMKIKRARRN